jgi:hypothetical protein
LANSVEWHRFEPAVSRPLPAGALSRRNILFWREKNNFNILFWGEKVTLIFIFINYLLTYLLTCKLFINVFFIYLASPVAIVRA